jgi:hypothetical protein
MVFKTARTSRRPEPDSRQSGRFVVGGRLPITISKLKIAPATRAFSFLAPVMNSRAENLFAIRAFDAARRILAKRSQKGQVFQYSLPIGKAQQSNRRPKRKGNAAPANALGIATQ